MSTNDHLIFQPYQLHKKLMLKNRIVMAPMTRNMADSHLVPTLAMADYYQKRADAGLIITEGTIIRPDGRGFSNVPGIFTPAQIEGWRRVTEAVHEKNGHIFLQIWHVGRVSHPYFLEGNLPLAPSATVMTSKIPRAKDLYYGQSREMNLDEIKSLIESYAKAAANAIHAGFDGVEIHGANGYLVDQFLHHHTNQRIDNYGGSIENRTRFALEVIKSCGDIIGLNKVAIRLSPGAYVNEILGDARDYDVFHYLLDQLNRLDIAYIHTGNYDHKQTFAELRNQTMANFIRQYYQGTLIDCGSYNFQTGSEAIVNNQFDLLALGRPFLANSDLIARLKLDAEIESYHESMLTTLK